MKGILLAGIREILVVATPGDRPRFEQLLNDGVQCGLKRSYAAQAKPRRPLTGADTAMRDERCARRA